MSVRIQQTVSALRSRGLARTSLLIWRTLAKEGIGKIPPRDRWWLSRHGFKPVSYVLYDFAHKDEAERGTYFPDQGLLKLGKINGQTGVFLQNKLAFHRMMARSTLPVPELVAVIRRGKVSQGQVPYREISLAELALLGDEYFVKPISGARGNRVRRVVNGDVGAIRPLLKAPAAYIVVRTVVQANYSERIFPGSFNTVRAVAMRTPVTREVFIPCAVHRFGSVDTVPVDNWSQGGLSCAIDSETGVMGDGIRHSSCTGGVLMRYQKHPDTDEQISAVEIPHWQKAVRLVNELMDLFPDIEYAGWDLLPTNDGWCVIEGNHKMDVNLLQVHRGLLADDRVKEFMEHHCPEAIH